MNLTDGRVTVRTPTADDAPAVADAVRSSVDTLLPWMPWASDRYSEDDALEWINLLIDETAKPMLILDESNTMVGATGVNRLDSLNHRANLGYWLTSDASGRGYATAAARLAIRFALEELGLHRLDIMMSVENEPSRRVAERLGATHEGVLRHRLWCADERHHDAHVFSVIVGDRLTAP